MSDELTHPKKAALKRAPTKRAEQPALDLGEEAQHIKLPTDATTIRVLGVSDHVGRTVVMAIRYGVVAYCFYCLKEVGVAFAGKDTNANILLNLAAKMSMDRWFAYAAVALASGWAVGERVMRQRKVAKLSSRLAKYEKSIDPKRTSSTLPPSGHTRREDEP